MFVTLHLLVETSQLLIYACKRTQVMNHADDSTLKLYTFLLKEHHAVKDKASIIEDLRDQPGYGGDVGEAFLQLSTFIKRD